MDFLDSKTKIGLTVKELVAIVVFTLASGAALLSVKSDIAAAVIKASNIEEKHDTDVEDIKDYQKEAYEGLKQDIRIMQEDIKQLLREARKP